MNCLCYACREGGGGEWGEGRGDRVVGKGSGGKGQGAEIENKHLKRRFCLSRQSNSRLFESDMCTLNAQIYVHTQIHK